MSTSLNRQKTECHFPSTNGKSQILPYLMSGTFPVSGWDTNYPLQKTNTEIRELFRGRKYLWVVFFVCVWMAIRPTEVGLLLVESHGQHWWENGQPTTLLSDGCLNRITPPHLFPEIKFCSQTATEVKAVNWALPTAPRCLLYPQPPEAESVIQSNTVYCHFRTMSL